MFKKSHFIVCFSTNPHTESHTLQRLYFYLYYYTTLVPSLAFLFLYYYYYYQRPRQLINIKFVEKKLFPIWYSKLIHNHSVLFDLFIYFVNPLLTIHILNKIKTPPFHPTRNHIHPKVILANKHTQNPNSRDILETF